MSISNYLLSGTRFNKAKNLAAEARLEEGEKADALFQEAYENFSTISSARVQYPDSLYLWGLALLNQAHTKSDDIAIKILEEAIIKFNLCDAVRPNHLGASLDGGVAHMDLARIKGVDLDNDLYTKAKESFLNAEEIQSGSASYNLACLYALHNDADASLESLEKAREHNLLPDEKDILNDSDLDNVKQATWFDEFITSLSAEIEETEKVSLDLYK